jgi:protease-4
MLFASILGVFIAGFFLFFICIAIMVGMLAGIGGSKSVYTLSDNTVLQLDLSGTISDRSSSNFSAGLFSTGEQTSGLDDILKAVKTAKENDKVRGIYLKNGSLQSGYATLEPIRKALTDFRESGKFVVAYGDYYGQGAYYVSSVADRVVMNPQGMFMLRGMAANMPFLKGTFDKLGIRYQVFRVGTFKAALEPLVETKMSDANREQVSSYMNCIWSHLLKGISESRAITVENLNRYADEYMTLSAPEKSVEYGLVDTLMYAPDVKDYIRALAGLDSDTEVKYATVSNLNSVPTKKLKVNKDKIAVLYAEGQILSGESKGFQMENRITDEQFVKELVKLKKDRNVKAVVFRVNSPGGSAYASEQIWRAVAELKKEKPVIVSMGEVAASGGYYISCAADVIVAEPTTLTGSIGGFAAIPEGEELFKKMGVTFDGVKTNKHSDLEAAFLIAAQKAFNSDERQIIQGYVNRFIDVFYTRCADGRSKTMEEIDAVGQGRVWTGAQALQNGLVDELGSLDDAIRIAAERAELTEYDLTTHPEIKDPFTRLLEEMMGGGVKASLIRTFLGEDIYGQYLLSKGKLAPVDMIQALMIPEME